MNPRFSRSVAKRAQEHFSSRRNEMLALTRALVEAESPSGDLEGSREVVKRLEDASAITPGVISVDRIESPGYGIHFLLRAFVDRSDEARPILMIGHTDTVHPRGSISERPWREEGGRIHGPGVFDMKANCALALEVIRACEVLDLAPRSPLVLLLTCDEEAGSMTGRRLIEEEAAKARSVLVLEPPAAGGRVKTGRKGTGIFNMEAHGIAAHAGLEPEKGASAILEMAKQIQRLHSLSEPASGITVNVGTIEGGTRSNVVAAYASAEIDVRFNTSAEARRIEQAIVGSMPFDDRIKLVMSGGINRPPLERTEKVIALFELARSIAATLDFQLEETSVGGASDGNFVAALGVPVLDGLGIDGDGAHATHEHIVIDDIDTRGAMITGLLSEI